MSRLAQQHDVESVRAGATQIVSGDRIVHLQVEGASGQGVFAWRQISGPTVDLRSANTATPSFRAPDSVTNTRLCFEVEARVGGELVTDTCVVVVNPDHGEPVNDAGPNQEVEMGEMARLHGSCMSTSRGLLHRWVQTAGKRVALHDEFELVTKFEAPFEVGTLRFELTTISARSVTVDTVDVEVTEPYLT